MKKKNKVDLGNWGYVIYKGKKYVKGFGLMPYKKQKNINK
jgi:hypothetical protein